MNNATSTEPQTSKRDSFLHAPVDRYVQWLIPRAGWVRFGLVAAGLMFLVYVLVCAQCGLSSRYFADDFTIVNLLRQYGFFPLQSRIYDVWDGRYSATFIVSLAATISPQSCRYMPAIALSLWCAGAWDLSGTLVRIGVIPKFARLTVALSPIFFTLVLTPSLFQPLFWQVGNACYALPLSLLFCQAALVARIATEDTRGVRIPAAISAVLSFVLCGFVEFFGPVQIAAYGMALFSAALWAVQHRRRLLLALTAEMAAAVLGAFVVAHAPGNAVRSRLFADHPHGMELMRLAVRYSGQFLERYVTLVPGMALTILLLALLCGKGRSQTQGIRAVVGGFLPAIIAAVSGGVLVFVCYLVTTYAMSTAPLLRTRFVPLALLETTIVAVGVALGGQIKTLYAWIPARIQRWTTPLLAAPIALLLLSICSGFWGQVQARTELQGVMQAQAAQWDRDDAYLRSQRGKALVRVPKEAYNGWFLSTDPRYNINTYVAQYYHIGAIEVY